MKFFVLLSAVCVVTALNIRDIDSSSVSASNSETPIVTAEKVYHTVIKAAPFLVDSTTTFVWTQTPTETPTSTSA